MAQENAFDVPPPVSGGADDGGGGEETRKVSPAAVRTIGRFAIGPGLGKGKFGQIKQGRNMETGDSVALKFVDAPATERRRTLLEREVLAMRRVSHPNVLRLYDVDLNAVYAKKDGTLHEPRVLLVLELARGGDLFDYLINTGAFSEDVSREYTRQLLSALQACHAEKVYHRDLKPENLLLSSTFQLKVADFGLAAVVDPASTDGDRLSSFVGTRNYMAPELLLRREYDGEKADVWSVGVILFIMLTGAPPFTMAHERNDASKFYRFIATGDYRQFWLNHLRHHPSFPRHGDAMAFLNRMLVANQHDRATVSELLRHEWMATTDVERMQEDLEADMENRLEIIKERKLEERRAAVARQRARKRRAAMCDDQSSWTSSAERAVRRMRVDSGGPCCAAPTATAAAPASPAIAATGEAKTFDPFDRDVNRAAEPMNASPNTSTSPTFDMSRSSVPAPQFRSCKPPHGGNASPSMSHATVFYTCLSAEDVVLCLERFFGADGTTRVRPDSQLLVATVHAGGFDAIELEARVVCEAADDQLQEDEDLFNIVEINRRTGDPLRFKRVRQQVFDRLQSEEDKEDARLREMI